MLTFSRAGFSSITGQAAYIVAGARTPIGVMMGKLSKFQATELGALAVQGALARGSVKPESVDEVILGNVCGAGLGQAPARQVTIKAKLPIGTPSTGINKVCASGMKTIAFAAQSIALGLNGIVVAGGFESMSNVPHYVNMRRGLQFGNSQLVDGLAFDGLTDAYQGNQSMGACAEKTALDLKLTRQLSDDYAINSYERTLESQRSGRFAKDIVSVEISPTEEFSQDEEPKRYNKDRFAQLKTVFKKDGTITAANASKLNDGACAIIVASEAKIKEYGLTPLARIVSYADAEVEPVDFCVAPAKSSAKALSRAGLKMRDIQFHEINEAFSTTVLANMKLLDLPIEQVNVWGGAVALGHPLGMSGARIVLNLINILKHHKAKYGMASICNGGGGATSIIVENLN